MGVRQNNTVVESVMCAGGGCSFDLLAFFIIDVTYHSRPDRGQWGVPLTQRACAAQVSRGWTEPG